MAKNRFSDAAKAAKEATNKQLEDQLADIKSLDAAKIRELLPADKDKKAFNDLMDQVKADTTMDEKLAFLTTNIKSAGVVAFKLLKGLV